MSGDFYSYKEPTAADRIPDLELLIGRLTAKSQDKQYELEQLRIEIAECQDKGPNPLDLELEKVRTEMTNTEKYCDAIKRVFVSVLSNMAFRDIRRVFGDLGIRPFAHLNQDQSEYFDVMFIFPIEVILDLSIPPSATGFKEYLQSRRR